MTQLDIYVPTTYNLLAMKLPDDVREYFRKQGALGGKTRAARLSPAERQASARKAVQARWAKSKAARAKKGKVSGGKP